MNPNLNDQCPHKKENWHMWKIEGKHYRQAKEHPKLLEAKKEQDRLPATALRRNQPC